MTIPFEDPKKAELRKRLGAAVDAAGHEVLDPTPITLPDETNIRGSFVGDVHSLDSDGVKHVYYVRTNNNPLPPWISKLATAAHDLSELEVYVVVEESSALLEKSCRQAGAGLLLLAEGEQPEVEQLVRTEDYERGLTKAQYAERVRDARRRLESKLRLNLAAIEENYGRVDDVTAGMPRATRDSYISEVEEAERRWRTWSEHISVRLDEAAAVQDDNAIAAVEALIEGEPFDDPDPA